MKLRYTDRSKRECFSWIVWLPLPRTAIRPGVLQIKWNEWMEGVMNLANSKFAMYFGLGMLFLLAFCLPARSQAVREGSLDTTQGPAALPWQMPARWRHGLRRKTPGTLTINNSGVRFQPRHGSLLHWSFEEIQTFDLAPRRLVLTGYQNRHWHLHGERSFRFDMSSGVPPGVAAALARKVGKPSENGVANSSAGSFAMMAARHRTLFGGTNGALQFRNIGIDYVTESGKGARSWRWADIETLTLPDAYHLIVGGYRESFTFELKGPMSHALFDRVWDLAYAQDLTGLHLEGGRP